MTLAPSSSVAVPMVSGEGTPGRKPPKRAAGTAQTSTAILRRPRPAPCPGRAGGPPAQGEQAVVRAQVRAARRNRAAARVSSPFSGRPDMCAPTTASAISPGPGSAEGGLRLRRGPSRRPRRHARGPVQRRAHGRDPRVAPRRRQQRHEPGRPSARGAVGTAIPHRSSRFTKFV